MNKTAIEWCNYTWNPVVGCKKGCKYCYAKRLNDRFKWIPEWTDPCFYPDRLKEPAKEKKPSTIFVGSMCDLFGDWVSDEWIIRVLEVAMYNPQHKFMFLTKNPKRYHQFEFTRNCWLGTTIDYARYKHRVVQLDNYRYLINKFVSVEPLLSDMSVVDFAGMNLVIIGAQTGAGAKPPQKSWIKSISHDNIFYKENIKQYL